jgi:histidine kinase
VLILKAETASLRLQGEAWHVIDLRPRAQIVLVAGVSLAVAGLATWLELAWNTQLLVIHLAYVPALLAAFLWGLRGALVGTGLALFLLGLAFLRPPQEGLLPTSMRSFALVLVSFMLGMLREQLRARERRLQESEARYRVLFDKTLAGVFVYRDERVVLANSRMEEILGAPVGGLEGKTLWKLFHPADHDEIRERVRQRELEGVRDHHYEVRMRRLDDGATRWVDLASSSAQLGHLPGVLVHVVDVTERREALRRRAELTELTRAQEEQLVHSTRLAELGEMAAQVAHELNQPLTGIRNFAANATFMLENQAGEPGELKDTLKRIGDQVDRAARIIQRMRQLSRKSDRQLAPVELNALVTEAADFLAPQLNLSGVEVELRLAPGLPLVLGDRMRLEQVLLNLLTNARQAMEEARERKLVIATRLELGPPDAVLVEVADTGCGFQPEERERLFRPFYSTKKPGQGTGLGLSISLSIVKEHQGSIEAVGAPGQGATFTVRLPVLGSGAAAEA